MNLIPLVTAIIVGILGYIQMRTALGLQTENSYRRFKLEKIQESLDEIIRPREELLVEVRRKGDDEEFKFFVKYCGDLDYYWERTAHYCIKSSVDEMKHAKQLKKEWPMNANLYLNKYGDSPLDPLRKSCHDYKKCIASILIFEARNIVEDAQNVSPLASPLRWFSLRKSVRP